MEEIYMRQMLDEVVRIHRMLTEKLERLLDLRIQHALLQVQLARLFAPEHFENLHAAQQDKYDDGEEEE